MTAQLWQVCFTCRDYAKMRRDLLAEPLANKAQKEGRDVIEVVDEFMNAAHKRHMDANSPLYPGGPSTVTDPRLSRLAALMSPGLFGKEDA